MKTRNKKGFTLSELLMVVVIISVLVSIAIPTLRNRQEISREDADLSSIRAAYADLMSAVLTGDQSLYYQNGDQSYYQTSVELQQNKNGWETNSDKTVAGVELNPVSVETNRTVLLTYYPNYKKTTVSGGIVSVNDIVDDDEETLILNGDKPNYSTQPGGGGSVITPPSEGEQNPKPQLSYKEIDKITYSGELDRGDIFTFAGDNPKELYVFQWDHKEANPPYYTVNDMYNNSAFQIININSKMFTIDDHNNKGNGQSENINNGDILKLTESNVDRYYVRVYNATNYWDLPKNNDYNWIELENFDKILEQLYE